MIPVLYDETETEFTSNGIGRLSDVLSCRVTEERNGAYDLEMIYPENGRHYEDIEKLKLIYAVPADGKPPQPFEIYRISSPISGRVSIYAHHISYRLNKTATMGKNVSASPTACKEAMQGLIDGAILPPNQNFNFVFETDVTTGASYKQEVPASVKSRLLGTEGSILDQFGGEYEWDKFNVILHKERGSDKGVSIKYGKNLIDLTQEYNIENTVTGVIPYWKGEEETITGDINYSKYHEQYSHERIVTVDFTEQFEEAPSASALNNLAQIYANEHGTPSVSIKVSFINLAQTEEYKDVLSLSRVNLCDIVTVQYENLGINEAAKVSKTVYDVLAERYIEITVGDITPSLAQTITAGLASDIDTLSTTFVNKLSKTKSDLTQAYTEAIISATAWITGSDGYVMAVTDTDGTWKELIFASSKDMEASSTKILRINNNGIGFSTSGLAGPYTNAWTIDGHLVADFMDTGTLNAAKVKVINLDASNITSGTISAARIAAGSVSNEKLPDTGISTDKLMVGEVAGATGEYVKFNSGIQTSKNLWVEGTVHARGDLWVTGDTYLRSRLRVNTSDGYKSGKSGSWKIGDNTYEFANGILVDRS